MEEEIKMKKKKILKKKQTVIEFLFDQQGVVDSSVDEKTIC